VDQLARDALTGDTMGAGDNRRAAVARKATKEAKQAAAQEKQRAAADHAGRTIVSGSFHGASSSQGATCAARYCLPKPVY